MNAGKTGPTFSAQSFWLKNAVPVPLLCWLYGFGDKYGGGCVAKFGSSYKLQHVIGRFRAFFGLSKQKTLQYLCISFTDLYLEHDVSSLKKQRDAVSNSRVHHARVTRARASCVSVQWLRECKMTQHIDRHIVENASYTNTITVWVVDMFIVQALKNNLTLFPLPLNYSATRPWCLSLYYRINCCSLLQFAEFSVM